MRYLKGTEKLFRKHLIIKKLQKEKLSSLFLRVTENLSFHHI